MEEKKSIILPPGLVEQLKQHNLNIQQLILKFGQVELQQKELNILKEELDEEWKKEKQTEKQLSETLQKAYGNGNINLETGEFIPVA